MILRTLEPDITSGISEIKLLISDFSVVDFRFSGMDCDLRFLISESWFQIISDVQILNSSFRVLIFELLPLISG